MKILKKATVTTTSNGTFDIQIEDWSEDYPGTYAYGSTLATYPISKVDVVGPFAPKRGQKFRCAFEFKDNENAEAAFTLLERNDIDLENLRGYLREWKHLPCLTGVVAD